MNELVTALQSAGFGAAGVHLDSARAAQIRHPMIVFVEGSHFAVILAGASDSFEYLDPPAPPSRRSWSSFRDSWDGTAIIVAPVADELRATLLELEVSTAEPTS